MALESAIPAFIAKAMATKAFNVALSLGASQLKQEEAERLLAIVAMELNEAVGPAGLDPLLEDERTAGLIAALLADPANADDQALATAIEPHVGRRDEETSAADYAMQIAVSLRRNVWKAHEQDRVAIIGQLQTEMASLRQEKSLWASPRFLSDEWIPRSALDRVKDLAETCPDEAASLEAELVDEPHRRSKVASLINHPPRWARDARWQLWSALGHLAATYGLIESAEKAFEEAAERPGADRASLFARASLLASARDDEEKADQLLERAQGTDAAHAEVVAASAHRERDPERRLDLLDGVVGRTPAEVTSLEITKMRAHLELNDYEAAVEACERALVASPNSLFARQLRASIALDKNRARIFEGGVDRVELHEAARQLLELADELDEVGRNDEAARLRTQASACYSIAGERVRAARLLEAIPHELVDADQGLRGLATRSAFEAHRADMALAFIGVGPVADDLRVLRAKARLELEADDAATAIVSEVETLIESADEGVREEAALLRLLAALRYEEIDWSEPAERVVRGADPALASMLAAERLAREGFVEEAEELLLADQEDPRVLETLVRLAVEAEDWPTALQRQRTLLDRYSTPNRVLDYAGILERANERSEAFSVLAALRSDAHAPTDVRASAFGHSADIAWQRGQYAEFDAITAGWLELVPDNPAAAWARVGANVRLARYAEATALINEKGLEPRHLRDARAAVQAFYRALPPAEAIRRIAEVSDRFDRSDAWLEMMVILSGLGARGADLPEGLRERVGLALAEFEERFPDSGMITSFKVPESSEGLDEWFREQFDPESAKALVDLQKSVMEGKAGVAHLAGFVGKEVATIWTRLFALPLGFGNPADMEIERQDALAAIRKPAVWETAALYTAGGLGAEVEAVIRSALLGSVIPLAVLDDAGLAAEGPKADEQGEILEVGWDPFAGEPRKTVFTVDEVEQQRRSLAGVLSIAHDLLIEDNIDPDRSSRFDELYPEENDAVHRAIATIAATVIVADRLSLPVYSDDRFIRALARGAGMPTFGTPALIEALVERGLLTTDDRDRARLRLRLSGAHGLPATAEEMIEAGRAAGWQLTPLLVSMLADRGFWFDPAHSTNVALAVLRAVFDEAADEFTPWVARFVDAACFGDPEHGRLAPAVLLLASAWLQDDSEFIARLTEAIGDLRHQYGFSEMRADYIGWAAGLFIRSTRHLADAVRSQIIGSVLEKLDAAPYHTFVRLLIPTLH